MPVDHRLRQRSQSFIITGIVLIVMGIILEALFWWLFYIGGVLFIAGVTFLCIGIVWHCQYRNSTVTMVHVQQPQPTGATVISTSTAMGYPAQQPMGYPPPPPGQAYPPPGQAYPPPGQAYGQPPAAAPGYAAPQPPAYGKAPGYPPAEQDPAYPPGYMSAPPPPSYNAATGF